MAEPDDHDVEAAGLPWEIDDEMFRQVVQIRQLPETVACPREERSWGRDCADDVWGEAV